MCQGVEVSSLGAILCGREAALMHRGQKRRRDVPELGSICGKYCLRGCVGTVRDPLVEEYS
jgi:hypothetical protein